MGSMAAARRAGYRADRIAMVPRTAKATVPVCHVGNRPAKKSGIGSRLTSAHRPNAMSRPVPPLISATMSASRKNCRRMLFAGAPSSFAYSDLASALLNRHQHHVHDTEATEEQSHNADRA